MNPTQPTDAAPKTFRRYYRPLETILGKPKNRVYTTTILSFLTVSLFVWFAIRPTIQTILSLRREIKDSTIVSEQMETKISALVEAQAAYQSISFQLPLLDQAVPPNPDMIHLIKQIENLALSVDATVSATTLSQVPLTPPSSKEAVEEKMTTPVVLTVDGTYQNIKDFIKGIYQMRRILSISDISLLPLISDEAKDQTKGGYLTMTLTVNAYSSFK